MNLLLHATHDRDGDFWHKLLAAGMDALMDSLWSIPVLLIAYFAMELLENSKRLNEDALHRYSRKSGPLLGGLLGVVPQCGISGAAATLFSTGSVTVGTMLAVFLATSDEMLPILLSSLTERSVSVGKVAWIVGGKAVLAIALGYIADLLLKSVIRPGKDISSFCEREHCHCEEEENKYLSAFRSALKHTLKIAVMLVAVNFALNLVFTFIGVEKLSGSILSKPVIGVSLLALFGLIPNCSVSVILTRSYLSGIIGIGGLFAGLLSNGGIGLLVLFRNNKNRRENLIITFTLFALSAVTGIVLSCFF
ncbi:MAG: arsenic efflux protein [Oscillospiraceae bacterium]|nr:arsenic efflux protein [Oscillospiraceae bacterium]